ncbi:MAG: hemerythrin family protein [Candidatus Brocadiaceae bacterium]|nr:hemerythrin family protein [Candidatus Brocadiaceae bacterium]
MNLEWSDDLLTGNELIDTQHKELFRKAHSFIGVINSQIGEKKVSEMLEYLRRYVVQHFHDEEYLMAEHDYDGLEIHRKEHFQFTKDIRYLRKMLEEAGSTVEIASQIQIQMSRWLKHHIHGEDKKLAIFMKNKDLKREF